MTGASRASTTATLAFVMATLAATIVACGGPILRPAIVVAPTSLALVLIALLLIVWPLALTTTASRAVVAGQGAVSIVLVATCQERPFAVAVLAWLVAVALVTILAHRLRPHLSAVWSAMLLSALIAGLIDAVG